MYTKPNIKSHNGVEILNLIGPGHSASGYVNIQGARLELGYNTQSVQKEKPATMLVQLKDLEKKDSILA